MLGLGRVDRHIFRARIFADDHPLINFFLRTDKQLTPGLDVVEGPSTGNSRLHGNERPGQARQNFTNAHPVLFEHVTHHTPAARYIHNVGFKSDQPASGNGDLEVHAVRVVGHVHDLTFASGQILKNIPETLVGNFDPE